MFDVRGHFRVFILHYFPTYKERFFYHESPEPGDGGPVSPAHVNKQKTKRNEKKQTILKVAKNKLKETKGN